MDTITSDERTTTDLILFAIGFVAFLIGAGGIAVASAPADVLGAILLLLVVFCFSLRADPGQ